MSGRSENDDDDAIVARARRGDAEAFALIFYRYKLDVWNLACFKLSQHHEAEDAVQETFLRAYRRLDQYRGGDALRAWLLTICRNVCLDRLRRRPLISLEESALDERIAVIDDPDQGIDLRRALAGLPAEELEAFFLVDVLGCRSEEAARILNLPAASTLRSRVGRARRQIADALSDALPQSEADVDADDEAEIWGVLHAPPDSAIVVSFRAGAESRPQLARAVASVGAPPPERDLMEFFDLLDRRIPANRRVVAIIGDYGAGASASGSWLADHPRWQLQRVATQATWVLEAGRLVERAAKARQRQEPSNLLALLNGEHPFLWTVGE